MGSNLREMLAASITDVSRLSPSAMEDLPSAMEDLALLLNFSVSVYINSGNH